MDAIDDMGDNPQRGREEGRHEVNREYLNSLLEMGIPEDIALRALSVTSGDSLELAASRALEIIDGDSDNENWEDVYEHYKMVFVVNDSLRMGVGKIAAQVAHAAIGLYKILMNYSDAPIKISAWQEEGEKKVVLRGSNEAHLKELTALAINYHIAHYAVRDAGLTEIPANSFTVLGLFGLDEDVDKITKPLKLL